MSSTLKPISVPFSIEDDNQLIGIDRTRFLDFFKMCFSWCKKGKIYQFSVKEVTAAEVQQNYFHLCMSLASESTGMTPTQIEYLFRAQILKKAISGQDENFNASDWVIDVIDPITSEIVGQELERFSKWDTTMLTNFLDYFELGITAMFPNFKMPNPKDYTLEVKGKKRQLPFPELKMTIKV
jgi:hypothetical protein